MTPALTREQQGTLVVAALDLLWQSSPAALPDYTGCCPACCAMCGIVHELLLRNDLNEIVMWAPTHMWKTSAWWRQGAGVDREWLHESWSGCPNHKDDA